MDRKIEEKFIKRFDFYSTYSPMYPSKKIKMHFDCGSGWEKLLWDLSLDLEKLVAKEDWGEHPFKVQQVKEKYSTLSFYVNHASDKIFDRIEKAEIESATICEICGKDGKHCIRGNGPYGWHKTLCFECAQENDYSCKDFETIKKNLYLKLKSRKG